MRGARVDLGSVTYLEVVRKLLWGVKNDAVNAWPHQFTEAVCMVSNPYRMDVHVWNIPWEIKSAHWEAATKHIHYLHWQI